MNLFHYNVFFLDKFLHYNVNLSWDSIPQWLWHLPNTGCWWIKQTLKMNKNIFQANYIWWNREPQWYCKIYSYLCGKSTTMPPENPACIAAFKINSRWSTFSGYTWKTALAPLAKHLYKDVKKALQKNINYIVMEWV